jgi:hypothetical protein
VGYATCLSGKWHLASDFWTPSDAWPTRRGFERFFGTLSGCGSYYRPATLTRGEQNVEHEAATPGFFYTDAITEEAEGFVRGQAAHNPGSVLLPEMLICAAEVVLARLGRRMVVRPLTRLPSSIRTPEGRCCRGRACWPALCIGPPGALFADRRPRVGVRTRPNAGRSAPRRPTPGA